MKFADMERKQSAGNEEALVVHIRCTSLTIASNSLCGINGTCVDDNKEHDKMGTCVLGNENEGTGIFFTSSSSLAVRSSGVSILKISTMSVSQYLMI